MAIEAPLSRYKRNNFLIGIIACVVLALWFAYDGYFNEKFVTKHTEQTGASDVIISKPDSTLVFNQKSPPFFALGALLLGGYWYAIRNRRLVAAEDALVIAGRKKIPYDAIESIDKTHFKTKGLFTITYKNESGSLVQYRLSDRQYDNLELILDHLVAQIT